MPVSNMRKLSMLVIREEFEQFLHELLTLGCAEISEAEDFPSDSELYPLAKREIIDLAPFKANKDSISVLGTKYTVYLTGWLPTKREMELIPLFKNFICAWALEDTSPEEALFAPVQLRFPWFFGKHRLAGRKLFSPLAFDSETETHNESEFEENE
ncbi:MAG: hypothetical protein FWC66_01835 [Oscillospiraceae bacterium]|nr:hypothetical protein [Oscillospiraceae bacterium]